MEDDDCNYVWVEDAYFDADDLAEHAIASPVPYDGYDSWDELDRFEYFVDIEYDTDGYHDTPSQKSKSATTRPKRKAAEAGLSAQKRRKGRDGSIQASVDESGPRIAPICWVSQREQLALPDIRRFSEEESAPFALLKDYRVRFKHVDGFKIQLPPSDPLQENVTPVVARPGGQDDIHAVAGEDDSGDEDGEEREEEEDDDDDEEGIRGTAIDQESLKAALSQNLSRLNVGANQDDQQMLLELATRMLNGEASSEELAGELATTLLGDGTQSEKEGAATGLSEWIQQQIGPKAMEGEEDEDMEGVEESGPEDAVRARPSPPTRGEKSTTEEEREEHNTRLAPGETRAGVTPSAIGTRKRKAVDSYPSDSVQQDPTSRHETDTNVPAKKKTRTYNAPTVASQSKMMSKSEAVRSAAVPKGNPRGKA
ncbi:hypothetical protein P152DRAFT_516740 [Eremomyces bilateralis CBS 781.70]|uniref:Uncharacterized protein n=1 Tax=Eremomyces bilateralis CBS 781.70 TaxID=1392243 RepID=A0A6G1FU82_9PEZI|nr:uncharacterized protein P152DRAFT_516740 [Eremomyces bilateralis CBS 781.70]KAF1809334.1 hypothetical protein P152DRAFT_516740 [Eremomyces bilateralis CBS 781.70]